MAGGWLSAAQVGAVTGLTAGVMTILFGLVANLPFGLAAGLGINSFLAVSVINEVTWPEAMGLVVINGILIVALRRHRRPDGHLPGRPQGTEGSHHRRHRPVHRVHRLRRLGLRPGHRQPGPRSQLGDNGSISSVPTLVFIVGLLVMGILVARKVQGGLLIGIVATTLLAALVEAVLRIGPGSDTNPGGWHLNTPVLSGQLVSRA